MCTERRALCHRGWEGWKELKEALRQEGLDKGQWE